MNKKNKTSNDCRLFYVDESGDLTFFRRGKPANFETEGISKFFLIGAVKIKNDKEDVENAFAQLRKELLEDPFIKKIKSAQHIANMFHAKDDPDIVRREVFRLIKKFDFSVQVIFRRKQKIIDSIREQYKKTGVRTRINEKDLYNSLISRLFKNSLHKSDCAIFFSQRGKTFTDDSLKYAIEKAKRNFYVSNGIENHSQITIISSQPQEHIGLQIIDYYLWALQRMLEKEDDTYFNILKDDYKLIVDMDNQLIHPYGEYYDNKHPFTLDKLKMQERGS